MHSNRDPLVSSGYIYAELLTLFRARGHVNRAKYWVDQVQAGHCPIIEITQADIPEAILVYFHFADKSWSFTDCTSRVVMERLGIQRAFAFDEHFRQFGTVTVVPGSSFDCGELVPLGGNSEMNLSSRLTYSLVGSQLCPASGTA